MGQVILFYWSVVCGYTSDIPNGLGEEHSAKP